MTALNLLLFLFFLLSPSSSYKVLLFAPTQGHSHVEYFGRIGDALIDAGHEVVRCYYSSYLDSNNRFAYRILLLAMI